MVLVIRLFAGLADALGTPRLEFAVEGNEIAAGRLKLLLAEAFPDAAALIRSSFFAKNQTYADDRELLRETDEIALIPPVSGGEGTGSEAGATESSGLYVVTGEPLSVEEVCRKVNDPQHGATIAFVGTTREMTNGKRTVLLEYDAYVPMAVKTLRQIGDELAARWPGTKCAISHRIGAVGIGEISVVIAVSCPHRAACYEASRYAIERLKQIVPIWKKEVWDDGSEWKGHQTGPWNPLADGSGGRLNTP